ncbi:MAG: UDP-N-acetylmuramoyl-L-alanyl-D-glutamate--2,6-diaminopimelate ligase [Micavibrio sp.]|nr:MAG: UDP-N-acetylmuramoyl-L-alanyl-D-glutamate--2,6-diaminopimelate ligase [Micavibrio sp.]
MNSSAQDIKNFKGLTQDSRQVKPGYLFAALPGSNADGSAYINDAVRSGASAVLAPKNTDLPAGVELITDDNPRRRFALMAAAFYEGQPDYVAAVTGTNGKTSVVHFAQQLWEAIGVKAASIGTLGLHGGGMDRSGSHTTPDPVSLHEELAELSKAGVTHLAMEASSHGLDQYRLDGVKVKVAGFTNLSRDHLDYHESMEEYLAAKTRLFTEILGSDGIAVLNADSDEYDSLRNAKASRILSYGHKGEDLKVIYLSATATGQKMRLEIIGEGYDLEFPLVGEFQLMNALCALGLVIAEDPENSERTKKLVKALEDLKSAPGRLQLVDGHPSGAAIYVDYAHTPDALEHVLKALRPHTKKNLACLFGCGGDRDKGKRPLMGNVAEDLADRVIVTDDNPRWENPAQIRQEILETAPLAKEIAGRAEAIHEAITGLNEGDVLVIAGKGHEQGQIFGDEVEDFDDVKVAVQVIEELKS